MSESSPSVAFHTGVVDTIDHALRLTRKAISLGSRVLVVGSAEAVHDLDEQLWTAEPGSFLPHVMWSAESAASSRVRRAPVWLWAAASVGRSEESPLSAGHDVLINLGSNVPHEALTVAKVFEVVSVQAAERAAGQQRWRAWRDLGISPAHHAFS